MDNIGRITLKEINGKVVYDVKLRRFDIPDTVYGFPGGGAVTYENSLAMREALQTAKGYKTATVERATLAQNIPKDNIKAYLTYHTGSNQQEALDRVNSLWLHNATPEELYAEFHY
jgi:hypothetical protein